MTQGSDVPAPDAGEVRTFEDILADLSTRTQGCSLARSGTSLRDTPSSGQGGAMQPRHAPGACCMNAADKSTALFARIRRRRSSACWRASWRASSRSPALAGPPPSPRSRRRSRSRTGYPGTSRSRCHSARGTGSAPCCSRHGRPADAEAVYRADLKKYPKNGWSLIGLSRALAAQGKPSRESTKSSAGPGPAPIPGFAPPDSEENRTREPQTSSTETCRT